MGIAIADVLAAAGARVTLVLGPTPLRPSRKVHVISVVSALDMQRAVKRCLPRASTFIATAAVSDWRFSSMKNQKQKKGTAERLNVTLVRNPDILAEAGRAKKNNMLPLLIGFSLETSNVQNHALKKLESKNLDLIIANRPETFSGERIRGLWIERPGTVRSFTSITKQKLATKITSWLSKKLATSTN